MVRLKKTAFCLWMLHWSLPSHANMSKTESPKEQEQREALHWMVEFSNNWEPEESFWPVGNGHGLHGNARSKHQMLQGLWVCHMCHCGGSGCSRECKTTQGGWKSGIKEGCLKRRFSKTRHPLNCKKIFVSSIKKKRHLKNITKESISNSMGKLKWLKSCLTEAVARRGALLF